MGLICLVAACTPPIPTGPFGTERERNERARQIAETAPYEYLGPAPETAEKVLVEYANGDVHAVPSVYIPDRSMRRREQIDNTKFIVRYLFHWPSQTPIAPDEPKFARRRTEYVQLVKKTPSTQSVRSQDYVAASRVVGFVESKLRRDRDCSGNIKVIRYDNGVIGVVDEWWKTEPFEVLERAQGTDLYRAKAYTSDDIYFHPDDPTMVIQCPPPWGGWRGSCMLHFARDGIGYRVHFAKNIPRSPNPDETPSIWSTHLTDWQSLQDFTIKFFADTLIVEGDIQLSGDHHDSKALDLVERGLACAGAVERRR